MPQGRRRAPFSGKAKKQQMQAKKQRKNPTLLAESCSSSRDEYLSGEGGSQFEKSIQKLNKQPQEAKSNRSRYALRFFQESQDEIQRRKEEARQTIESLPLEKQEISDTYFPPGFDLPKRPPWDFNMSKEQLELREEKYFREYVEQLKVKNPSYFELNLETWRQLWRVLEMSDIFLMLVDIRYPVLMFPPYLYRYVIDDLGKNMVLVLNKIDLAPPSLVVAWQDYFRKKYPQLHILMFTSYPNYNLRNRINGSEGLKKRRRKGKLRMAAEGAKKLLEVCKHIVGDDVNLSPWEEKIHEEMESEYDVEDDGRIMTWKDDVTIQEKDTTYFEHVKYKNGVLTIGCIGTPNVGKSSLMNALMGKKVVSVSRTPGHTKHFQTIFLTKTVCLCDCPGLVFPSTVPKQLQILMGSFPIAQVKEPYTSIKFLAERINLPALLNLQHQDNDVTWSAMDICDSWAVKRSFRTAKTGRPDTYRAANSLLRIALEGTLCIFVYPPGWSCNKESWENHPDVEIVKWIQASSHTEERCIDGDESSDSFKESAEDREEECLGSRALSSREEDVTGDSEDNDECEGSEATNKFQFLSADM